MKTYVTISLSKEDIDVMAEADMKKTVELDSQIHDIVDSALTLMVGGKLVQLKITNLPMREES